MSNDRPNPRRHFLRSAGGVVAASAALTAVPFISARGQSKLRPVSMRLDWLFQGPNVGFIVAKDKGFYEKAGLDVKVGPGKGSGSTAQLVAVKDTMFGFSDGYVVGNSVAKGMDIIMIGSVYRRNPTAVVVLADSPIKKPKDLEGKTVGIPTGAAQYQQWPAFVKGCHLDGSKIKVVNIDPAGSPPALITGKVAAIAGFAQGYVPSVEIRGNKKARILWYADCGVDAVSNGIIIHRDLLGEKALLRDFVAASIQGFLYGRQHPDEMAAIVKKFSPVTDERITKREAELSWDTWVTPNTRDKPLGWMSEKDWESTVQVLKQYGGVTAPLEASRLFTNDFVPSGAQYLPPQPKA